MRNPAKLVCAVMALCLMFLAAKDINADPVTLTLTNQIRLARLEAS